MLDGGFGGIDDGGFPGSGWDSLQNWLLTTFLLPLCRKRLVLLNSALKLLLALGRSDVLDSDRESLGDQAIANLLVDDDTDGSLRDVPNLTSLSVVELIGHSPVNRRIHHNVHVVTQLVLPSVHIQRNHSASPRSLGEQVASTTAISVRVRHTSVYLVSPNLSNMPPLHPPQPLPSLAPPSKPLLTAFPYNFTNTDPPPPPQSSTPPRGGGGAVL